MRVNDVVRGRVEGMTREMESGTHGCRGQESVKNYVDRMQAGLQQRLGVCGAGKRCGGVRADVRGHRNCAAGQGCGGRTRIRRIKACKSQLQG